MSHREFEVHGVGDPRLAMHATSAAPAWLWSLDGSSIIWANPVGARLFGAANAAALAKKPFGPAEAHRRQVARLAGRLSPTGAIRMERLHGFGAAAGALMTCCCARLVFPDGSHGILIAAAANLGRTMPLIERLQRLVQGVETPIVAFARDGLFVGASDAARALPGFPDLSEAGLEAVRSDALANGRVEMPIGAGHMVLQRVGSGSDVGLIALIAPGAARSDTATAKSEGEAESQFAAAGAEPKDRESPTPAEKTRVVPFEAPPNGGPRTAMPRRRHPLRFDWQMDADERFSLGSDEFTRLIGPRTAVGFGRPWREIAEIYGLDPAGRVIEAVASREPWKDLMIFWPVDGGGRLPVELSALPISDADGNFAGYRGVGVCRVLDSLDHLKELRALEPTDEPLAEQPPAGPAALPFHAVDTVPADLRHAAAAEPPATSDVVPTAPNCTPLGARALIADDASPDSDSDEPVEMPENVVPFRPIGEPKSPALTAVENNAFDELARQLSARLERENAETDVAGDQDVPPEWLAQAEPPARGESSRDRALLDLLPTGILIYRLDRLLYANPAFLERIGYHSLHTLEQAGGLETLYVEPGVSSTSSTSETGTPVTISASQDFSRPALAIEARLFTISWDGDSALALMFAPNQTVSPPAVTAHAIEEPVLKSVRDPVAEPPPEHRPPSLLPAAGHTTAEDLANTKADMLARISQEVRTPLNAILRLAEVMLGERFGALGDERYMAYTRDIRASGERVITIINDLLELARLETGRLDLAFADQNLNEMVESCVSVMQPQANRERIIIRTSLAQALPPVVADGQTLRQITMNLIGNSIHLANPAGQVIVSTALSDFGEVVLRVRDSGHRLNDNEIAAALEPFRNPQGSDQASDGSAVNLSLTKALVEANRARFHIKTGGRSGTLIEVIFPHAMARA